MLEARHSCSCWWYSKLFAPSGNVIMYHFHSFASIQMMLGTTWTQEIMSAVLHDGDLKELNKKNTLIRVPFLELTFGGPVHRDVRESERERVKLDIRHSCPALACHALPHPVLI